MNHTLNETYNLDTVIQSLQTKLYDSLIVRWNTSKLDAYGRVYKNERDGKVIPEVYTGSGYKEVMYNNQSCLFFVDDDDHKTEDEETFTTDVKIVFMLNLSDLKTATERVDADIKRDAIEFVRAYGYDFKISNYEKGLDNVLKGFNTHKIKNNDMHPLHVFALKCSVEYSVINKC